MTKRPPIVESFWAARRDPELAVLEGFHAVKHALRFGATIVALVGTGSGRGRRLAAELAPDVSAVISARLEVVSPELFSQLAPQAPSTGVMAIARRRPVDVKDLVRDPAPPPIVLLEDPRHLGNLGACVRVAAAADVAGVLTTGAHDPWHPEALRAAAGLHFALPVARAASLDLPGRPLIAVDPGGEPFAAGELPPRAVLAFGGERYGLSDDLLNAADQRLAIPMRPGVSSLNLATAVAAVLFARPLAQGT
jgi:TrmH family RNA methyltransferase